MQKLVVVESVQGKFGPQVKDVTGAFYSFSKFYKGPTTFTAGTVLEADIYTTAKGGKYLNKATILEDGKGAVEEPKLEKKEEVKKAAPAKAEKVPPTKYGKPMSEYELEVERRISRAGVLQAVLQCPALAPYEGKDLEEKALKLFEFGMKVVNG